jgi:glucosamine--fructose-6-phosphate aminotransferase (isomerizing)
MCGIVGYIGDREAQEVLLTGLERLEYRGYDSAGVAIRDGDRIELARTVGRLAILKERLQVQPQRGCEGIGHTRWATHGRPSEANAHPHRSCGEDFAVVHNGIIENYLSLREALVGRGHRFVSETDTEIVAHLLEEEWCGNLRDTVLQVVAQLQGAYALVIMAQQEPGTLVAVRRHSPLVVGRGEQENFLASDIPALLPYTRSVHVMQENEVAVVRKDAIALCDVHGQPHEPDWLEVTWSAEAAEKGGYDHFMAKEIHEQPRAVRDTLRGRISADGRRIELPELHLTDDDLRSIERIHIVACGTSFHAGLVGRDAIERLTRIPVDVEIASEYRYRDPIVTDQTMIIAISQSGETLDTLAAVRGVRDSGRRVLAITNVVGSSLAREADDVIITWAGPEISVCSTKAYTTQLVALYLLAARIAQARDSVAEAAIAELAQQLLDLPAKLEEVLATAPLIEAIAQDFSRYDDAFFLGRGLDYAVALEGALKYKEITYIHAEAYPSGELKHGTLALIVPGIPVIALMTQDALRDKSISNIREVKARDAHVLAITWADDGQVEQVVDRVLRLPRASAFVAPILVIAPLQLLAYYAAVARNTDVDKPRNLAKSVTVE